MGQYQNKSTSITDLPLLPQSIRKQNCCKSTAIHTTLTAWWKTNKITKSSLAPCKYTPIWYNPDFQLHNTPIHFLSWQQKGITHLHHLFQNNPFLSLNTLILKNGIGRDQFLQYQQLKSVVKSKINITGNTLQPSKLSKEILKIINSKKKIPKFYEFISTSVSSTSLPVTKWEKDLSFSPSPDLQINKNIFFYDHWYKFTTHTIQHHPFHITQSKMFKMGLINTDACSQYTLGSTDSYLHATWVCQPVHAFWTTVTEEFSTVLGCRIPMSPSLCLLGDIAQISLPLKYKNSSLISNFTANAHSHKSANPPSLGVKRESQEAERESDSSLSAVSHLGVSLWFRPGAQISSGHNRDSY